MSPLPLSKMNAMRTLRHFPIILLTALCCGAWTSKSSAQTYTLSVDSVIGIPDTIYDGQTISFTMVFSNLSNLGFQGQVETVLYFPNAQDTITADVTSWPNSFVQAQSQTQVAVSHFFTSNDNNLAIGDNVVVVWPRIASGPTFPPQEVINEKTISFYLAPPLSVPSINRSEVQRLGLFPNPAQGEVRLVMPHGEEVRSFRVTDLSGRTVLANERSEVRLNADALPAGIYTVTAISGSGQPYFGRLMVGNR
jgi:hypothetical protein